MFFMTKSALCIGIVSALALSATTGEAVRGLVETGGREAAARLGQACAADATCVDAGARIVSAAFGGHGALPGAVPRAAPLAEAARPPRGSAPHVRRIVKAPD